MESLIGKPISYIKQLIDKKEINPKEVFEYFSKRIKKYNNLFNAYITSIDYEENKNKSGNLYGIPLAIKDNFCTKGIRTTASAKVLEGFIPPYESTVTQKLKNAGATFLGKTNLDAWAHGSSTETSDYGPSKNPHDISKAPGGSSGGTAVAIASYLAPAGIGSETAGSIRQPAAWTGIVGLKPTYGRVSRYGVVAMGSSLDSPGPMTLTTQDAATIFNIICGKDKQDATTIDAPTIKEEEYTSFKKFKIGIPEEYLKDIQPEILGKFNEAVKILEKMGHTVKSVKMLDPQYAISVYTILQRAEVSSNLSRYTGLRYGKDRSLFGKEAKRRVMLGTYTLSHGYYDAYYEKAQKVRTLIIEDFKKIFLDVDIIIAPTTPVTALTLGEFNKYPFFGEVMDVLLEPSSIAGIPGMNLPIGTDKNEMPIGMQIMGNYLREADLLNCAYSFEKETNLFGVPTKLITKYPD